MAETLPRIVNIVCDELIEESAPNVIAAAYDGIKDVASMMRSPLEARLIGSRWGDGDYESTQWFIDRSYMTPQNAENLGAKYRSLAGKVIYDVMRQDLADDPYRRIAPHLGYMLLSRNLTSGDGRGGYLNFVFGITSKQFGQSIQSIYKYIEADLSIDDIVQTTRLVARHEFGHLIGLDDETIIRQDQRGGVVYNGHCANECTMQQIVSVKEAVVQASKLVHRSNAGFCGDCTNFVRSR